MMEYTNTGLVEYAKRMIGLPYWYGTFGQIGSEALYKEKRAQYPSQYDKWDKSTFTSQYGKKVQDCSGLIKAYLMTPDNNPGYPYNPAVYNSKWDWSANGTIEHCEDVGDISKLPEIPGLILWKNNHVGIYLGGGEVIEAKGHAYGVIYSRLSDTKWVKYGKHPAIKYEKDVEPTPAPVDGVDVRMRILRKGDKTNQVSLLQMMLRDLDYLGKDGNRLAIDKSFGGNTEYAVKNFQKDHGLESDGVVGYNTWRTLVNVAYK